MTNVQKAQRLERQAVWKERIAHTAAQDDGNGKERSAELLIDAALLREAAAMMRERGAVQWMLLAGSATQQVALYRGWLLEVREDRDWLVWTADSCKDFCEENYADSLEAAQAAAVAWVDEQEGK